MFHDSGAANSSISFGQMHQSNSAESQDPGAAAVATAPPAGNLSKRSNKRKSAAAAEGDCDADACEPGDRKKNREKMRRMEVRTSPFLG